MNVCAPHPHDKKSHQESPSMNTCLMLLLGAILLASGCIHENSAVRQEPDTHLATDTADESCNTVPARIWALINNGQFAEAQALIAEAKASGLIAAPMAARMLDRISLLNTRVGQLPATLQRARDFPSQLKDYTLYEVKQMLEREDFSLATKAQLNSVVKILQNPKRLMEKL